MDELAPQLALLDSLIENWASIRLLMEPVTPALDSELGALALRLREAVNPDQIDAVLNALMRTTLGTPAHAFLKDLIRRSQGAQTDRGPGVGFALAAPSTLEARATLAANTLGQTVPLKGNPLRVPIFFCTNRNRISHGVFGTDYGDLGRGVAHVTIPVAHETGRIETPRWWSMFPGKNAGDRFLLIEGIDDLPTVDFNAQLEQAATTSAAADLLVFMHGFRVTFEEAARRAAQLAYDLSFPGVVCLFSWPSLGTLSGYEADTERSQGSAKMLSTFLQSLEGGPWRKVHLVAHSMGSRVLTHGLAEYRSPEIPLSQLVFVAADIDTRLFGDKFADLSRSKDRVTSYASGTDRALLLSGRLHKLNRVGLVDGTPYIIDGLETVDASAVDSSLFGLNHSYFGDVRTVLTDLGTLVRECSAPAARGLKQEAGKRYWIFPP